MRTDNQDMIKCSEMNRTNRQTSKTTRFILSLVAILLIGLSASGCASISNLFSSKTATTTKTAASNGAAAKDLKVYPNDAPGYDLKDLPRFPASLRLSFTIVKGDAGKSSGAILYQTTEEARKVEAFFEEQIEKYDWKLDEMVITKEGQIFRLRKGSRKVSINVATREGIDFTDITYIYREY